MKKLLLILAGLFIILIAAAVVLPIIYKDKIIALVKTTANESVNARIDFDNNITLSLFKNFPDFTLGIHQLSVAGINRFEGDTLLSLNDFTATLDLMSVLKGGPIRISSIELGQPRIHAWVLKDGTANWDITKPSTDTTKEAPDTATTRFNIQLKKFAVTDAYIRYEDLKGNMGAEIAGLNHTLSGDFSEKQFLLQTFTSSTALTVIYGGIPYLNHVNLSVKADVDADMEQMKFTFKDNQIDLNALSLAFTGWVGMSGEDIQMDLSYQTPKAAFKEFLSLIPAIYAKDYASLETSGKLGFNGFVKGTYNDQSLPSFAFNLLIENGMFKYPALPFPVKDVQVKLAVTNPDGVVDHTRVDLSQFHFNVADDPFDARLIAEHLISDPSVDAFFKGRLNLNNTAKIVPLEQGTSISGLMNMQLTAKGRLSTLEKKEFEKFDASGNLQINDLNLTSPALPKSFRIAQAAMAVSPAKVTLSKFDAQIGKSDFQLQGELTDFFAYALGKGTIHGVLNFTSGVLDANEFLADKTPEQAPQPTDTTALTAPEIPDRVDFTLNSSIGKLLYTNLEINAFVGQIHIAGQKLEFNRVALKTLGSDMSLDGYYETTNPKTPTMSMLFGIQHLDIQKAFVTFNTVKKLAPIAESTQGTFSTRFSMETALDQHLNPKYDQLFAQGMLDIPNATIKDVEVFNKAAKILKYDQLRDPSLKHVHIQFKVEKGRIHTQPFDIAVAGQKMTLSGSTGLDQTIDYTGKVMIPRTALGAGNTALTDILNKANTKAGTQVKLSEQIPVALLIGGTFTKPDISTNLGDVAKSEASSVKDQLAAEADKKRRELEAKARAEADRLKQETEAKARAEADRLKKEAETKAKAEADRLKKEAEAKAKAEEERLKKKAEEEAKKKLKGLLGK